MQKSSKKCFSKALANFSPKAEGNMRDKANLKVSA